MVRSSHTANVSQRRPTTYAQVGAAAGAFVHVGDPHEEFELYCDI
jgi:hypothetical protein